MEYEGFQSTCIGEYSYINPNTAHKMFHDDNDWEYLLEETSPPPRPSAHRHRVRTRRKAVSRLTNYQMLMIFLILLTLFSFIFMFGYITLKTRPRKMRQARQAIHKQQVYADIRDAVDKQDEIAEDMPHYEFSEDIFNAEMVKTGDDVYICKNESFSTSSHHMLLFTTLPPYVGAQEVLMLQSTIQSWSYLLPKVKPVIFVPQQLLNLEEAWQVVDLACKAGFDSIFIENNVQDVHPILRNMFETVYKLYEDVTWYGYSNYRQIFDSSLYKGLRLVEHNSEILEKSNLVVGRSQQFEVGVESFSPDFPDMDLNTLVQELYYLYTQNEDEMGDKLNYFFTTKYGFPWQNIPALIAESEDTDKFIMWYTMKNTSILAVDATDAIFTLHQTHNIEVNNTDYPLKSYNNALIAKWKYPQYYKKGLGTINCIEYKLTNNEIPYYVLVKRTRKYIRSVLKSIKPYKISYRCKIVKLDNLAMMGSDGKGSDCTLTQQVNDLKNLDVMDLKAHKNI